MKYEPVGAWVFSFKQALPVVRDEILEQQARYKKKRVSHIAVAIEDVIFKLSKILQQKIRSVKFQFGITSGEGKIRRPGEVRREGDRNKEVGNRLVH